MHLYSQSRRLCWLRSLVPYTFWFIGIHGPSIAEPAIAAVTAQNLLQQGMHAGSFTLYTNVHRYYGWYATSCCSVRLCGYVNQKRNRAIDVKPSESLISSVNEPVHRLLELQSSLSHSSFTANVWINKFLLKHWHELIRQPSRLHQDLVLFLVQTSSSWSFALAALLIVVDIVIYYPFSRFIDEQIL